MNPPPDPPHPGGQAPSAPIEIFVAGEPILRLLPEVRRVAIALVISGVRRSIDISIQPGAACRVLEVSLLESAAERRIVDGDLRRAVAAAVAAAGVATSSAHGSWLRLFGALPFPILGAAYEQGATPLSEVPRWAAPVLAAPSIREAMTAAFGSKATKPVRRAFARSLVPEAGGVVNLAGLAAAVAGAPGLEPDRLVRVLSSTTALTPASLPDAADLRLVQKVIERWTTEGWSGAAAEGVLVEAASRPDGLDLLVRTATYARQLGGHGPPHPLPGQLQTLHDLHRSLIRSEPTPTNDLAHVAPQTPAARQRHIRQRGTVDGARPPVHQPLAPLRSVRRNLPTWEALPTPASARGLDGHQVGDITLLIPHTVNDLIRWGRILSNCLGDFGPAAAMGDTLIVGVQRRNRLIQAVEITPNGRIRQFCGTANRAPSDEVRRLVIGELAARGVVRAEDPANSGWLIGVKTDGHDDRW